MNQMEAIWTGKTVAELRNALSIIAEASIPDQPATDPGDQLSWAQQHVAKLRRIAQEALRTR